MFSQDGRYQGRDMNHDTISSKARMLNIESRWSITSARVDNNIVLFKQCCFICARDRRQPGAAQVRFQFDKSPSTN
jgi:hypothetical protein